MVILKIEVELAQLTTILTTFSQFLFVTLAQFLLQAISECLSAIPYIFLMFYYPKYILQFTLILEVLISIDN